MYIKKIKIVDNRLDSLQEAIGKTLINKNNKIVEKDIENKISIRYGGPQYQNASNGLYELRQTIILKDDISLPNSIFHNHLSEIIVPTHINEIAVNDDSKAVSSGYVKAKFNFVSEQYERFTNDVTELDLPCIYLENDPQQTKTIMDQKVFTRVIPKARSFYDFNYILKPRYKKPNTNKCKNLMFGQNFSFNIGNAEREQYPFYNNIRFNYHTNNDFKAVLKSYNFFEHFIDDYINSNKGIVKFKTQISQQDSTIQNFSYKMFDTIGWLQKSDFSFDETNKMVFEPTQEYKSSFQHYLDKLAFVGKMRKFCINKMRNIQEIHNNKTCNTETLSIQLFQGLVALEKQERENG